MIKTTIFKECVKNCLKYEQSMAQSYSEIHDAGKPVLVSSRCLSMLEA